MKWEDSRGNEYHLIVGIGLITTNHDDKRLNATVQRSQGLGLQYITYPPQLTIGYASLVSVVVPDGTQNLCAEVSQFSLEPFTVTSCDLITPTSEEE